METTENPPIYPPSISNLDRAIKAINKGATLCRCSFYRGGQTYRGILTTINGKQFAVPSRIMEIISSANRTERN